MKALMFLFGYPNLIFLKKPLNMVWLSETIPSIVTDNFHFQTSDPKHKTKKNL